MWGEQKMPNHKSFGKTKNIHRKNLIIFSPNEHILIKFEIQKLQ